MEAVIVEIRSGEGGADAKDLVREQLALYWKYTTRRGLEMDLIEERNGIVICRVTGKGALAAFENEAGGHRWMRVPPNEKRGRVQTSTVTVATLPEPTEVQVRIDDRDLEYQTCRSSGAGGQKVNKTDSAVQLTHLPTGIMVRVETERSQHQNRATALSLLRARLLHDAKDKVDNERAQSRREQVGTGQRADKRRTISIPRGTAVDHMTGKVWQVKDYMRGNW